MMRKIVIYLILIIGNNVVAQSERNVGDLAEPVPSVSSFTSYINTPVNISSGVPDISIPLYNLETNSKSISLPLVLSYHPHNALEERMGSEVGLGWSLFSGGVISRKINEELDERLDDASKSYYTKNEFDDVYYYNIPGYSGKFRFIRDINNNTFALKHLSNNKLKIEYTRTSNTATLVLQSFTITDDRGIKYLFEDYSTALRTRPMGTQELSVYYKSAFYLSKIIDENNIEQVKFTYQKKTKYSDGSNGVTVHLLYDINKPLSIESSFGKVNFQYYYDENLEYYGNDDPYKIVSVSILNKQSVTICNYDFTYGSFYSYFVSGNQDKRILTKLKKTNKLSQAIEERQFEYDNAGSETNYGFYEDPSLYGDFICEPNQTTRKSPKLNTLGLLKKMTLPTKGFINYNFEANETFYDKSYFINDGTSLCDPSIQYLKKEVVNFNTVQTKKYNLTIDKPRKIYVSLVEETNNNPIINPGQPDLEPYQAPLTFTFKDSNGQVVQTMPCTSDTAAPNVYYIYTPGTYSLNIQGSGTGYFEIHKIEAISSPYKNVITLADSRIKNIKVYDANGVQKSVQDYNYNSFSNALNPSKSHVYKNVKVTSNNGSNGYIKYYFKDQSDYPSLPTEYSYKPFNEIVKDGLLSKVEVYNNLNNVVKTTDVSYNLEEIPNSTNYYLNEEVDAGDYSRPSWLKNKTEIVKENYTNGTSIQNSIETNYNINNFKPSSSKEISSDGTVTEMFIKYAGDKNIQSLINANMISVPLETEVKKNNKTIGKTETKYENTTNLFPSSVVSTNPNDASTKTTIKYENYDANGNLVQYTTDYDSTNSLGNPVTIIWGYNKTLPIAKIEGAKLSDIGILANDIVTKSNADIDATTENTLLSALDTFRNEASLKNYLITTYTYDPLIGMTSVTPPNGIRQIYKYDAKNQLEFVVDSNGNIIKQMKYNTKQ